MQDGRWADDFDIIVDTLGPDFCRGWHRAFQQREHDARMIVLPVMGMGSRTHRPSSYCQLTEAALAIFATPRAKVLVFSKTGEGTRAVVVLAIILMILFQFTLDQANDLIQEKRWRAKVDEQPYNGREPDYTTVKTEFSTAFDMFQEELARSRGPKTSDTM